jgi:hypothetical protein
LGQKHLLLSQKEPTLLDPHFSQYLTHNSGIQRGYWLDIRVGRGGGGDFGLGRLIGLGNLHAQRTQYILKKMVHHTNRN